MATALTTRIAHQKLAFAAGAWPRMMLGHSARKGTPGAWPRAANALTPRATHHKLALAPGAWPRMANEKPRKKSEEYGREVHKHPSQAWPRMMLGQWLTVLCGGRRGLAHMGPGPV